MNTGYFMDILKLQAYGKINLSLDVLRKREDGYHDVRMIMQTVRLHDTISMMRNSSPGITIETNLPFLPTNEHNLMHKAAKLIMDEFSINDGVKISLKKVIPVSGGMGGGSADAASVLFGMNRMFSLGLSDEELKKRGATIGADVPFCLCHGTALSEGFGEKLGKLPPLPDCHIVLARPGIPVSTRYVYEHLHVSELPPEAHPDIDSAINALCHGDLQELAGCAGNILETVTERENPVITDIKKIMCEHGSFLSLMSGSGPTVFGLFTDSEAADRCYRFFRYGNGRKIARQSYITSPWIQGPIT